MKASKILIGDDSKEQLIIMSACLGQEGHSVTTTTEPAKVIPLIEQRAPDLVFLDIRFGEANGLDILNEIKKINPKITVIMMTDQGTMQTATEAKKLGAYDYVHKPFKREELTALVKRALDASRLMKEAISSQVPDADSPEGICIVGKSPEMKDVPVKDGDFETLFKNALGSTLKNPAVAKDAAFFQNMTSSFEKFLIETTLERTKGNQLQAAAILGISRNTLRQRMKQHGLIES